MCHGWMNGWAGGWVVVRIKHVVNSNPASQACLLSPRPAYHPGPSLAPVFVRPPGSPPQPRRTPTPHPRRTPTPPPHPQMMSSPSFGESLVTLMVLGHTRLDQVGRMGRHIAIRGQTIVLHVPCVRQAHGAGQHGKGAQRRARTSYM